MVYAETKRLKKKMKELPVLVIDSREKQPLEFEGDEAFAGIEHRKLDSGDYSIKGLEHIIAIERKASVDELFVNFTKDKERIKAEFIRLKDYRFKVIVIEENYEDILNPQFSLGSFNYVLHLILMKIGVSTKPNIIHGLVQNKHYRTPILKFGKKKPRLDMNILFRDFRTVLITIRFSCGNLYIENVVLIQSQNSDAIPDMVKQNIRFV